MNKHPFQTALETKDIPALPGLFTSDIEFHSPIVYQPFKGRQNVSSLISLLRNTFADVAYTSDLGDEHRRVLVCDVTLDGLQGQNLQFLRFDEHGLIADITVFLRPLRIALALAEKLRPYADQHPDGSYSLKG